MSKTLWISLGLCGAVALVGCTGETGYGKQKTGDPKAEAPVAEAPWSAPAGGCTVTSTGETVDGSSEWGDIPNADTPQNCSFHAFAYNNFLWLAGDDSSGHPRFMSWASADELFPASGTPQWPGGYTPLQATKIVKSNTVKLDMIEAGQAGDSFELVDVADMTAGYDLRVNEPFFDYVVAENLYTKTGRSAAYASFEKDNAKGGIWLPPNDTTTDENAWEYKTSWRAFGSDASACPSEIMHCETDENGNHWGLVGMHLVMKTPTRGELVWGSFEHIANSPDCDTGGDNPIQQQPNDPMGGGTINVNENLAVGSDTGWNFFNYATYTTGGEGGTPAPGDGKTCTYPNDVSQPADTQQCNSDPEDSSSGWQQVNICRTDQLPPASSSCVAGASNGQNISCLNRSVLDNFPAGLAAKWRYYRLIGAEWMAATSVPTVGCFEYPNGPTCTQDKPPSFTVTGSVDLANTTMETWMQKGMGGKYSDGNTYQATDCFACHQPITTSWGEGDTSHMFTKIVQN